VTKSDKKPLNVRDENVIERLYSSAGKHHQKQESYSKIKIEQFEIENDIDQTKSNNRYAAYTGLQEVYF